MREMGMIGARGRAMNPLGLVIVTEYTSELPPHPSLVNRSNRNTQMFLDGRERRESEGPVIVIVQPDLRREVWLHTAHPHFHRAANLRAGHSRGVAAMEQARQTVQPSACDPRPGAGHLRHTSKHIVKIVSITECLLDPVLFEMPEGYRERPVFPSLWSDVTKQFKTMMRRLRAA
jgi:hypothetical protein